MGDPPLPPQSPKGNPDSNVALVVAVLFNVALFMPHFLMLHYLMLHHLLLHYLILHYANVALFDVALFNVEFYPFTYPVSRYTRGSSREVFALLKPRV